MAGSWGHMVRDDGTPHADPDEGTATFGAGSMLENMGDVQEALEECYGMVWFLASAVAPELTRESVLATIARARENYQLGVDYGKGELA
jgi:hypothetical protein